MNLELQENKLQRGHSLQAFVNIDDKLKLSRLKL